MRTILVSIFSSFLLIFFSGRINESIERITAALSKIHLPAAASSSSSFAPGDHPAIHPAIPVGSPASDETIDALIASALLEGRLYSRSSNHAHEALLFLDCRIRCGVVSVVIIHTWYYQQSMLPSLSYGRTHYT